ncbi:GntR family transcriptional regulator [Tateyamaria omphalii]|uniref:GntR family transcriptional regulator n=1 Tax=Tateyamaria omphalii TaxID=299262 RepID=UPI001C99C700|nr:GntR family transcriptional regulator [Tateyamaria omphalii]MBY5932701.1 GntR family transcriptional regulator [Tateyamaria omphalii]
MSQDPVTLNGLSGLAPVARETAQDLVYSQLRRSLICGGFDAGDVFKPADVAKRMSVSSMPVREALARLVSERALEAMPNRRVRVPLLNRDQMRRILHARKLIEGDLVKSALNNITARDITKMELLTDEYEAASNETEVALANHAFHFTIYDQAQSQVLLPFAESLWMQAGPYIRAASRLVSTPLSTSATKFHHEIIDALRNKDGEALLTALYNDLSGPFDILEHAPEPVWGKPHRA